MYSGNYNKINHMNGMAIFTSKLGTQKVIDTTPPHALNEFEYEYKEYRKLNPEKEKEQDEVKE